MKNKRMLKILLYMPELIYVVIEVILLLQKESINIFVFIGTLILLLLTSTRIISNDKFFKYVGFISLFIVTIFYMVIGYYDYIKWFSTVVSCINLIYYLLIYYMLKMIK